MHTTIDWDTCVAEEGCRGIRAAGTDMCLAHLDSDALDAFLAGLEPGSDLDLSGTAISTGLLGPLLDALRDEDGWAVLGHARFTEARFTGGTGFGDVHFRGNVWFEGAHFEHNAGFSATQFDGLARFAGVRIEGDAWFMGANFEDNTDFTDAYIGDRAFFSGVHFGGYAMFAGAHFADDASFGAVDFAGDGLFVGARFEGSTDFADACFGRSADFRGAEFNDSSSLTIVAAEQVDLSGAAFASPVALGVDASGLDLRGAAFPSGVRLELRRAAVDLEGARIEGPTTLSGGSRPMASEEDGPPIGEPLPPGRSPRLLSPASGAERMPVVVSLRGVDCTNLTLNDVDLSSCRFAGAMNVAALGLQGQCVFARPPRTRGGRFGRLVRWSRRRVLAEEREWRTAMGYRGWVDDPDEAEYLVGLERPEVSAEQMADLYRSLRRALEDNADQPGAADFYYGEMLFRARAVSTPSAERAILWAYWAFSGFGLRALRALAALAVLVAVTTAVLAGWGIPDKAPQQRVEFTLPPGASGGQVAAEIDTPSAGLPDREDRWTGDRLEKAARIAMGAVVFRDAGKELTDVGAWTVVVSRFTGPVLLALAVLAVRNRVKR
ncbi:pentapeptide repeat-containing protein [Nocardiopsis sp. RSe5-2]|uniref:Pentapeptide repeat-containing protein n=1 Tax=Nocardiopsis endophytica TaxID=3018445 RepID=A0ABT4U8Z8_9ACTN|nr:pentapeptide repeat-containing protein [Nocardiopsis endophytica]MDA2813201.1 pentapeptide repeat-containing protein [Nocardiopsis endophytica]